MQGIIAYDIFPNLSNFYGKKESPSLGHYGILPIGVHYNFGVATLFVPPPRKALVGLSISHAGIPLTIYRGLLQGLLKNVTPSGCL